METTALPKNVAAARTLRILSVFAEPPHVYGVTQLSQITDLDKSVVHRILDTLVSFEFLRQDPETRRYKVGVRAWEVGRHGESSTDRLVSQLAEALGAIGQDLGCTGYVACQDGADAVYLAVVNGSGPLRVHVEVGTRVPLVESAMGMAILAQLPDDDEVLERLRRTTTARQVDGTRRDLNAEIAEIRRVGHAVSRGISNPGVGAVGVAIRAASGGPVMAASAAFPMVSHHLHLFEALPPRLEKLPNALTGASDVATA